MTNLGGYAAVLVLAVAGGSLFACGLLMPYPHPGILVVLCSLGVFAVAVRLLYSIFREEEDTTQWIS